MEPNRALKLIKAATKAGKYRPDPHLFKQMSKRGLVLADVVYATERATRIAPHDMLPLNEGGESWRVYGKDADGRRLGVGVELVIGEDDQIVILITAFLEDEK